MGGRALACRRTAAPGASVPAHGCDVAQVPSSGVEAVPGLASHGEREYEYRWACAQGSAPSLRMWVPAQGLVCGVIESADDG